MADEETLRKARSLLNDLLEGLDAVLENSTALIPIVEQHEETNAPSDEPKEATDSNTGTQDEKPKDEAVDVTLEVLRERALFVSHAIHELRTPMTSIRGYSDMLGTPGMGELSDMQKQFVDVIRTNAKRMEALLTDVSDAAKIHGGTLKLAPKLDMFKNIALKVEKTTQPLADQLGRKLTFDIPSGLPMLETDGDMLAKALAKLVENGLRYQDAGEGEVKLHAEAEGSTLRIVIEDTGIGMTAEEMAQLGTLYFRSDNELVRSYKGSGLGTPIAYGIIRLLGGSIDVKSEPGKGTTFTVTLKGMA